MGENGMTDDFKELREAVDKVFLFRRYVGGIEMAESILIERALDLQSAISSAIRLCPKSSGGAPTILILEIGRRNAIRAALNQEKKDAD
jgi:hypothetical protein